MHRQDTWSDLQLFAVVNLGVIFLFGWLKTHLVDASDADFPEELDNKPFWLSIYQVVHLRCTHSIPAHLQVVAPLSFCNKYALP